MKDYAGYSAERYPADLVSLAGRTPGIPESALTPGEAFQAGYVTVPLNKAVGSISAEVAACYPPGIPVICPGERISGEIADYLKAMRGLGVHFQGCHDSKLLTIRVVK